MSKPVILLVEDNPDDIELAEMAFRKSQGSSRLVVARDGVEALDYLFATGPYAGRPASDDPRVVLLDLKLPKIDGIEVLRRIRSEPRTHLQPVVILSSSREQDDVVRCYDLGANSYVRKAVDFNQFVGLVCQLEQYWLQTNEPPPVQG